MLLNITQFIKISLLNNVTRTNIGYSALIISPFDAQRLLKREYPKKNMRFTEE
jgi:hypothetical protein